MSRRVEVLGDAPPEQKKGVRGFLGRHWGKILLALGLMYGAGKLGTTGALNSESFLGRNAPKMTAAIRPVSAHASRFTHCTDGLLKHVPLVNQAIGAQPADAAAREAVRGHINAGTVPMPLPVAPPPRPL